MPRNGAGVFTLPANSFSNPVSGTEIDAEDADETLTDIETTLTASIAKDGQTTTTAAIPFAQGITYPGSGLIDTSGRIGIGATPSANSIFNARTDQDGRTSGSMANHSAGTGAYANWALTNGGSSAEFRYNGTGFTTAGMIRQNGAILSANGAGGLSLFTAAAQPVYIGYNSTEVAQFTSAGLTISAGAVKEKVVALSDGATPALDASLGNIFTLAAAGNRTIAVPSNATAGQKIVIIHTASGGARTLALNSGAGGFRFGSDITALSETASGKIDYIGCIYNGAASFWDVVSVVKGY